jgi:hypothetical protein
MRTDAFNRFASSELCRSLQDGGKTPLTVGEFLTKHPKWHATVTRCVIAGLIELR